MDIAADISVSKFQDFQQKVGVAVASLAKDMVTSDAAGMIQMMEKSVSPHLGSNLDFSI